MGRKREGEKYRLRGLDSESLAVQLLSVLLLPSVSCQMLLGQSDAAVGSEWSRANLKAVS